MAAVMEVLLPAVPVVRELILIIGIQVPQAKTSVDFLQAHIM